MNREWVRYLVLAGGLALAPFWGCSKAAESVLAPAQMTRTAGIASADGAVAFWENGTLQSKLSLDRGPAVISIRAFGNRVDGVAPTVLVDFGGRPLGSVVVDAQHPKDFTLNTNLPGATSGLLKLSFNNHVAKQNPLQGRWLVIQKVTISQSQGG